MRKSKIEAIEFITNVYKEFGLSTFTDLKKAIGTVCIQVADAETSEEDVKYLEEVYNILNTTYDLINACKLSKFKLQS